MALLTSFWFADIFIAIFTALLYFYLKFKLVDRKYWEKRNIPYLEPRFIVGNTGEANYTKTLSMILNEIYFKHKDKKFIGMWTYVKPTLLVSDLELIKNILVKDFSHFHDRGITMNDETEPLTAHLFNMSGQPWRNLRVKLTPTFTSGKMKMMYDAMYDAGLQLQKFLEKSDESTFEMKETMSGFTTDVIASCAFGMETNTLSNPKSEFRVLGKKIFQPPFWHMISGIILFVAPEFGKKFKLRQMPKEVSDFYTKTITDVITYREEKNVKRNDFVQLLIELKNKGKIEDADNKYVENLEEAADGDPFTLETAAAQAFVFFFAGFETSGTTLMWTLYELALNPDVQEKLQAEIDDAFKEGEGKVSYAALQSLEYLEMVSQESLRKFSPVPMIFREVTKDYKVPGTDIVWKKGEFILIPTDALQYDPDYFPNPTKFDPERFSEEGKAGRDSFAHLPFGGGPRVCIGMRFGLQQVKVGLVMILSKFNVEVAENTPIPPVLNPTSFVPTPKGGMHLRLVKRQV